MYKGPIEYAVYIDDTGRKKYLTYRNRRVPLLVTTVRPRRFVEETKVGYVTTLTLRLTWGLATLLLAGPLRYAEREWREMCRPGLLETATILYAWREGQVLLQTPRRGDGRRPLHGEHYPSTSRLHQRTIVF